MEKKCLREECNNLTSNPKFCSLSCGSKSQSRTKKFNIVVCARPECKETFNKVGKHNRQIYCSRSCAAIVNNTYTKTKSGEYRKNQPCLNCGETISKSATKYCTNACGSEYRYKTYIKSWLSGELVIDSDWGINARIRKFLLEEANYRCSSPTCMVPGGWGEINPKSGRVPLTIDHIDGNAKNNNRENLIVLCPCCHALTPTFGSLNTGNGRAWRRQRYAEGKSY